MKKTLLNSLLLILLLPCLNAESPADVNKSVRKEVAKLFEGEAQFRQIPLAADGETLPDLAKEGDQAMSIEVDGERSGYLISTSAKGRYDYFDYTVIFTKDLSVLCVKVTTYRSSHGAEICSKGWLKQFKGYKGERIEIGKDVDSISGATLSSTSMVEDMQRVYHLMDELIL